MGSRSGGVEAEGLRDKKREQDSYLSSVRQSDARVARETTSAILDVWASPGALRPEDTQQTLG